MGCFKMSRIFRVGGLIKRMNMPEDLKAALNLGKFTFYLCLFLHCLACCWYVICDVNKDTVDENGRKYYKIYYENES